MLACWSSTEGLRQKEVLERETGMVYNVKTTTTTTTTSMHAETTNTKLPSGGLFKKRRKR